MKWASAVVLVMIGALYALVASANFAIFQVGGASAACWTKGADGWFVQCATLTGTGTCAGGDYTGTCFVAVTTSAAGDGCASHETLAAAIADPCKSLLGGQSKLRHQDTPGFPDHLVLNKGDTWTDQNIGGVTVSGKSASEPFVYGAYGTGARPKIRSNPSTGDSGCFGSAQGGGLGNRGDYIVLEGLECENYTRNPANIGAGFDPTNASQTGTFFSNPYHFILVEDCKFSFYTNDLDFDTSNGGASSSNLYVNRNIIVDAWESTGHSQGIHMSLNFSNVQITENVWDHNGWNETLIVPITATISINPQFVTASFGYTFPYVAQVTFHSNSDTLPTGFSYNTPYNIIAQGYNGANTLVLSSSLGSQFTASITGTTLAVTATAHFGPSNGDTVYGAGVSAGTVVTACPGGNCGGTGNYTVNNSQNVGSEAMTSGVPVPLSGSQAGTHKIAWDVPDSSPAQSGFNHDVYLDGNMAPVVFTGNIVTNGSCCNQFRPGGTINGNLFVGATTFAGISVGGVNSVIQNNVVSEGTTSGGGFVCNGSNGCSATNNLVANTQGSPGSALSINPNPVSDGGRVTVNVANPAATTWVNSDAGIFNGKALAIITCSGAGAPYAGCPGATTVPAHITCTASTTTSAPATLCYAVNATQVTTANFGMNTNLSLTPGGTPISTLGDSPASGPTCGSYGQICLIPMFVATNNTMTSNTVYNWGTPPGNIDNGGGTNGNSTAGNTNVANGGGSFTGCTASPSPNNCTVGNYNATISGCAGLPGGCTATIAAFMLNARSNSRDGPWNSALTAHAANAWIGAGFGMTFP